MKLYGAGLLDMHIAMRVRRLNFRFADHPDECAISQKPTDLEVTVGISRHSYLVGDVSTSSYGAWQSAAT